MIGSSLKRRFFAKRRCAIEALEDRSLLAAYFGFVNAAGSTGQDRAAAVATDTAENVYVAGEFYGTVDFDSTNPGGELTSAGGIDIFVAKYDRVGRLVWARRMGGPENDSGRGVAVDASGNVFTTGYFAGRADFNPGTGVFNLNSNAASQDIFVSKLDSAGGFLWAGAMGGPSTDWGNGIAVDHEGFVYTTGFFTGYYGETSDFDPGSGVVDPTIWDAPNAYYGRRAFVSKLTGAGQYNSTTCWAEAVFGFSEGQGIAVNNDSVFTTGWFSGTVDVAPIGDYPSDTLTSNAGSSDVYVWKLSDTGSTRWARGVGGNAPDLGAAIALDGEGNSYATGYFHGTADFNPSATASLNLTSTGRDVFVWKLTGAGDLGWAAQLGGSRYEEGRAIAVDAGGAVYATGHFESAVDFDPGAGVRTLASAGSYDAFVAKLTAAGAYDSAYSMGGSDRDEGNGIAATASGMIYTVGHFQGTADFDPSAATANRTSANWNSDLFVSQLAQPGPLSHTAAAGGNLTLRKNGAYLEIVADSSGRVLDRRPLDATNQVSIAGAANAADRLTIDYGFGGAFTIAQGIHFDGGAGTGANRLVLRGASNFSSETYRPTGASAGEIRLSRGFTLVNSPPSIVFANVQAIDDTVQLVDERVGSRTIRASITVSGTSAADQINIENGAVVGIYQSMRIASGGTFAPLSIANKNLVTVNSLGDRDTISIYHYLAPNNIASVTVDGGDAADSISVLATAAAVPFTVRGGIGNDTINVGTSLFGSLDYLQGAVTVEGGGQTTSDTLRVYGNAPTAANPPTTNWTIGAGGLTRSRMAPLNYSGFESVEIHAGRHNDNVRLTSTSAAAAWTINLGDGDDAITVGDPTLDAILGAVVIAGEGHSTAASGGDSLTLLDDGHAIGKNYTIRDNVILREGAASIDYRSMETVTVRSGAGPDNFYVESVLAGTRIDLFTGEGDDDVEVASATRSLDSIAGELNLVVSGFSTEDDRITVQDQNGPAGRHYLLSGGELSGATAAPIGFGNNTRLTLNATAFDDRVDIERVYGRTRAIVNTRGGNDLVSVGEGTFVTLDGISGDLEIDGGTSTTGDELRFWDEGTFPHGTIYPPAGNFDYLLTADSFTRSAPASFPDANAVPDVGPVGYAGFERLEIHSGDGDGSFVIESAPAAMTVAVFAGGGADNIAAGAGVVSRLELHGEGGGDTILAGDGNDLLEGGDGDDSLSGGAGNDAYLFDMDSPLGSDSLDDSAGRDALDFSATATVGAAIDLSLTTVQVVSANLSLGWTASTILENVLGTAAADTLLGNGELNALVGNGGNDTIRGRSGRDLLIGGLGADDLFGDGQEDILIGGATQHDASLAALDAILAEWGTGLAQSSRIDHLTGAVSGGANGAVLLNAAALIDDLGALDDLNGGGGTDWLLPGPGDGTS